MASPYSTTWSTGFLSLMHRSVIFLCTMHRGGVACNLITLLLCIPAATSTAEFNTVPPQLWLCAPLFLLCLVQVLEARSLPTLFLKVGQGT